MPGWIASPSLDRDQPLRLVPRPQVSDAAAATIGDAIRDDLFATLTHIGKKLGLPEITEGLFLKDVTLTLSERETLSEDRQTTWLTQPVVEYGHYSPCNLTAYKNLWSKETPGQPLSDRLHVTLTHEVIHCYQYQIIDDVYLADRMPPWISEGSAIWLAGNDTGIVEPMVPGLWRKFIMGMPQNPLTLRTLRRVRLVCAPRPPRAPHVEPRRRGLARRGEVDQRPTIGGVHRRPRRRRQGRGGGVGAAARARTLVG